MGGLFNLFAQSSHANHRFSIAFESHQGRAGGGDKAESPENHFSASFAGQHDKQSSSMALGFLVNSGKNQHSNRKLNFEMQMAGGHTQMAFSMSYGGGNERGANSTNQTRGKSQGGSQPQDGTATHIAFQNSKGGMTPSFSAAGQERAGQQFSATRNRSNAFSTSRNKSSSMNFSSANNEGAHVSSSISFSMSNKHNAFNLSASKDSNGMKANIGGIHVDSANKFKSAMSVLKNGRSAMQALKNVSGKK